MLRLKTDLNHLPARNQRDLERIKDIILQEFEAFRLRETHLWIKRSQIYKIILYGSFARDDWVDWQKSHGNYQSDYDILIIVNSPRLAAMLEVWGDFEQKVSYLRATHPLVSITVEPLSFVNESLRRGRFFFVDIVKEGIALYERNRGGRLARLGKMSPALALEEAQIHFKEWYQSIEDMIEACILLKNRDNPKRAVFLLHQAAETAYHCLLLVLTNYSPSSHNVRHLRGLAEVQDFSLTEVWPSVKRHDVRLFELLKDAYVKARYSRQYKITHEELDWLIPRVQDLRLRVEKICLARIEFLRSEVK